MTINEIKRWADTLRSLTDKLAYHFFASSEEVEEEVVLYFTQQEISDLTHEALSECGMPQEWGFLDLVAIPTTDRLRSMLFTELRDTPGSLSKPETQDLNSNSLLKFAALLAKHVISKPIYLLYIVLCLYILGAEEQEVDDNRVRGKIKEQLKGQLPNNQLDFDKIETLFERLHHDFPTFSNNTMGSQPYVGLLKYQLILKNNQVKALHRAIALNSHIDFTGEMPYERKMRALTNYVEPDLASILDRSNTNTMLRQRINQVLTSFDPESYSLTDADRKETAKGQFTLALCFSENEAPAFNLLSSIFVEKEMQTGDYTFRPTNDHYDEFAALPVLVKGQEKVVLDNYPACADDYRKVDALKLDDWVFFNRFYDNIYLMGSPGGGEAYVFVRRNKAEKWIKWAGENVISPERIPDDRCLELIGKKWMLYEVKGMTEEYALGATKAEKKQRKEADQQITVSGGMKIPGGTAYLVSALPCLNIPEGMTVSDQDVCVMHNTMKLNSSQYRIIRRGGKLIVDIEDPTIIDGAIEVVITYKEGSKDRAWAKHFNITGQPVFFNTDMLYAFDNWGDMAQSDSNAIRRGWQIENHKTVVLSDERKILNLGKSELNIDDRFYFINLLSACFFMNRGKNCTITHERFEKCANYAATRLGVDVHEEGFMSKLRWFLVNAGYMSADFSHTRYQAMPPTFAKIPRSNGVGQLTILLGSYTREFLQKLQGYCREHHKHISTYLVHHTSYGPLALLPPLLVLDANFSPADFEQQSGMKCVDTANSNVAFTLLSFCGAVADYPSTLEPVIDIPPMTSCRETSFPKVREEATKRNLKHTFIEIEEGRFERATVGDKAWNELYCSSKSQKAMIVTDRSHLYVPLKLHLPCAFQRALFVMNLGVPKIKKVFVCNNSNTDDVLYTKMKMFETIGYDLSMLYKKLTGSDTSVGNPLIADRQLQTAHINKQSTLTLYTKKPNRHFDGKPWQFMTLEKSGQTAYAFKNEGVLMVDKGRLYPCKGSVNEMLTAMISTNENWTNIADDVATTSIDSLPNIENYETEKITILTERYE